MRAELVRIGNSRGIRIPKPLIEQCGLREAVELRVENDCLIISAERQPRQGWREAFQAAGTAASNDHLLPDFPNTFDQEDWKW
ncbi:MAG: AbrB/MazE/SpoVT family DNA-binding domain-containing protein [Terriglobales bacterium]